MKQLQILGISPRRLGLAALLVLAACQSPADTTAPTIASSIPASGAQDVAVGTKLAITFSEAMKQDSVTVTASPATALGTAVWNDAKTVVYTPPGGWQAGTGYTLGVEGKDLAGNALAGSKTLSFQTLTPPDTTPPATPTGVKATAGDGEFSVEWNASPESDLAGYTVYFGLTATTLDNAVNVERPGLKTSIANLENSKTYFFAVDAYDQSGNHSARSSVGTVTPKDQTPPSLVSSEPANGAQDLSLVPVLRLSFSEAMKTDSLEFGLCVSTAPPASATCPNPSLANFGTPTWSAGDTVVQLTPTDQLQAGKTHVLLVFGKDKAGNDLGQTRVAFSIRATPDTTPPTVVMYGGTYRNDTPNPVLSIGFSEAMNQKSVQDAFLSQPPINCTWTWRGNTADCTSAGYLKQLTGYTVTIGTGASDTAGNPLAAPFQFSFTTDNFAPRVVKFSPSGKFGPPINVSVTAPIILTFSEAMDQGSTQGAFEARVGSTVWPGTFQWNADSTEMTYLPNTGYGYGKTVTWKITTAAREAPVGRLVGKALAAEVSSYFTTQLLAQ